MNLSIIFYDDVCVFCSWSVRLICRNDPSGKFQFAPIDSDIFREMTGKEFTGATEVPDSIVLLQDQKLYTKSSAALRIAAHMRFPWPLFTVFFILPWFIRNALYDLIARNRYRWFGKRDTCFVPDESIRDRFIG